MSSSILPFRAWIAALLALVAIESAVYAVYRPSEFDRTNFLQFSFAKDETPQRLFTFHKLAEFAESSPTIVQVGDSSGFYGIEPAAVMRYLPPDVSYLNMSCCANLGYRGYYNIFQFMAERNDSIRYLVLHITPYTMPRPDLWDSDGAALWQDSSLRVFGNDLYHEFISPWRMLHLPSLAFRREVTDRVYYLNGLFNRLDRPLLNNPTYLEFLKLYKTTRGWMPEPDDRVYVASTECKVEQPEFLDLPRFTRKTYLEEILETYAAQANRYRAVLVIVFQPVACTLGTGRGSAKVREGIERFKLKHPEVEIPFPLIETWSNEKFSTPPHVKREYTNELSDRLGRTMAEIIARRGMGR